MLLAHTLLLEAGQSLYFGHENQWALGLDGEVLRPVAATEPNLAIHQSEHYFAALRLAQLTYPDYPVPLGVYYQSSRDVFQLPGALKKNIQDLSALYRAKASWKTTI